MEDLQKEFVPYGLALRMKQLGFDEPCMASKDMNNDEGLIQLPLYQQAFRWFREKHGLGHMINGIGYETFLMNIGGVVRIYSPLAFNSYEEAELECIKKLLEIVEQNGKDKSET